MKSLAFIALLLATSASVCAQQLSETYKPYIADTPAQAQVLQCSDGNLFAYGNFETYGNEVLGKVLKVDLQGNLVPGFKKTIFDDAVTHLVELPSGKLLVLGRFTQLNGAPVGKLVRLNSDGSMDDTFNPDQSLGIVNFAVQSTGKIVIFHQEDGDPYSIGRLKSDGSIDETFTIPSVPINGNYGMAVDALDRVYFSGLSEFVRITADGPVDNDFSLDFAGSGVFAVSAFTLQPDGRPLLSITVNEPNDDRYTVIRLNLDGSVDEDFEAPKGDNNISQIIVRKSGKICIIGIYHTFNNEDLRGSVIELNDDGSYYRSVAKANSNGLEFVYEDSDESIYINGFFTAVNGTLFSGAVRIKSNRVVDKDFVLPLFSTNAFSTPIASQSGGRLLVGSYLTSIGTTGHRSKLIRLLPDGTQDETFNAVAISIDPEDVFNPIVSTLAVQEDDKILVGGNAGAFASYGAFGRLLPDGQRDDSFKSGLGPEGATEPFIRHIEYRDSKIYVAGFFDTFDGHESHNFAILDKDGSWIGPVDGGADILGGIEQLGFQSDGKIVVYGAFNDNYPLRAFRLNADGSRDNSFNDISLEGNIWGMDVDEDDNVWIFGNRIDFEERLLAKFDKDGTRDNSITFGDDFDGSQQKNATGSLIRGNRLLLAGNFTSYKDEPAGSILIIDTDGTRVPLDSNFEPGTIVQGATIQNDVVYLYGRFSENDASEITTIRKILFEIEDNVTTLSATTVSDASVDLSWDGSYAGAESVRVEVSKDNADNYQLFTDVNILANSTEVDELEEATKYYFRIRGVNELFETDNVEANAVTDIKPAVALKATDLTGNSFVANWEYPEGTDSVMFQLSNDNFSTFVSGYEDKILTTSSIEVTGLAMEGPYEYRVKRYRNGIASGFSESMSFVITGIEDERASVSYYPNPFTNTLTIKLPAANNVAVIYSALGTQVANKDFGSSSTAVLDVSALPAGLYILKVGSESYKIVKQ